MTEKEKYEAVVGRPTRPIFVVLATVALLLIVAGTLIPLFTAGEVPFTRLSPTFKILYTIGAGLLLGARILSPYTGTALRVKRLYRIEAWSAIFFCVGAFFLFYEPDTTRNWLAFTMAGGAIQAFASIMIPRAVKKALAEMK